MKFNIDKTRVITFTIKKMFFIRLINYETLLQCVR